MLNSFNSSHSLCGVNMKVKLVKSAKELMDCFLIRKEVFVKEQNVAFDLEFDLDELNQTVFIAYLNKKAVGTARVKLIDDYAKASRICVLKEYRRHKVGQALMEAVINFCKKKKCVKIKISAQVGAIKFYESLGFITTSKVYIEANTEHKSMEKTL